MLRIQVIENAQAALDYYAKTDTGYYYQPGEVRQEWLGTGAERLRLSGQPEFEQFRRLINGLHPDGGQLTAQLVEHRVPGIDVNVHCPKGVTTAINGGDARLEEAMWASYRDVVHYMEEFATTRVRKGDAQDDRVTGNLVGYGIAHDETRPTKEDGMPDWHKHIHGVFFNVTKDDVEDQWKAVKWRVLMDNRKLFDRYFNLCFSRRAAELGHSVRTLWADDGRGGRKYMGWDIEAAPGHEAGWQSINDKNSRRSKEVEAAEEQAIADRKARDADAPDTLSAVARDKLGATSRQSKRDDLTLAACQDYWQARITAEERRAMEATIDRARRGLNASPEAGAAEAMGWAIAHHFERSSVVDFKDLVITAAERCMGAARPEEFREEAVRQGVLFSGEQVSTQAVLDQERRIIGFAREGKAACRPLAPGREEGLEGLSEEQAAAARHVWNSSDQVMLVRGQAGVGKTTTMRPTLEALGVPLELLAPSSDASRGQLREKEGFAGADTVASFLMSQERQQKVRGGLIWVDEAGMLAIDDLEKLCEVAKSQNARLVLGGDPAQHKNVSRHGNMMGQVLEEFAGLPVARITKIQRQRGEYAQAVAAIAAGELEKGDAILRELGWVVEGQGHDALVAEYARAIEETKANGERKSVIVVDPTHKDGDLLTEKLREVRRDKGLIRGPEENFPTLRPLHWTAAERGDASRYGEASDVVIQFFKKSGKFKAGDRVLASELLPELAKGKVKPEAFGVFKAGELLLAEGDTIRITNNGRDVTGKHRLDNGRIDTVAGFTRDKQGEVTGVKLANGWILDKGFSHIRRGLVSTSFASQSKTEDIVLAAMNRASLPAMSAEQGYVTISRGRERGMVFTDLPREELLEVLGRADRRKSATELFGMRAEQAAALAGTSRVREFMDRVRAVTR